MMLSGPAMYDALHSTLFGGGGPGLNGSNRHASPGGGGMDQMIVDFVSNIYGPVSMLLTSFTYISAIVLLLVGITRLTKTAQDGPRGPTGLGTIMTFLASGALFAFGDMMGSFSSSLFGTATVSTYATISPTVISNSGDAAKISAVVEALMAFIMLVGFIAFIRGWFVLKAFADGNSNATIAQALTFLFGGALAINLGALVNVLQNTVGVSGITFSP
jgi:intracellular multiplication protein IcmC